MNKAELEAAISTLDTFIQVFAVLVAVGILGEVGFGVRHWVLSRRLAVIQSAEDLGQEQAIAALNKEAGDARRDAGLAIERAGKAEENLGNARKAAAEANERAANAEKGAIEANTKYEEERKARLLIEQRMADRQITLEQRDNMLQALKAHKPDKIEVESLLSEGREALQYAGEIGNVFTAAGWDVSAPRGLVSSSVPLLGVVLVCGNDEDSRRLANSVALVLIAGKVRPAPIPLSEKPNQPKGYVEILVGSK